MYRICRPYRFVFIALLALSSPLAAGGEAQTPSLLLADTYREGIDLAHSINYEGIDRF